MMTQISNLAGSSSRGPAADGRIKPDVGAKGTSVNSTLPNNTYDSFTGTSMACPGVAGCMAQLYQAYKELNGNINPPSALMKCVVLNSADDLGNPGPDFKHGWGEINVLRGLNILENNNYESGTITQGSDEDHILNIPAGTQEIKIMVYWHDKEASTNASVALVNDLERYEIGQVRVVEATGAEKFAQFIYHKLDAFVAEETDGRVKIAKVEFMEHGKNTAIYEG